MSHTVITENRATTWSLDLVLFGEVKTIIYFNNKVNSYN